MPSCDTPHTTVICIARIQQEGFGRIKVALGRQLLRHQLLLFGRVARAPANDPLRVLTFVPGSVDPATGRYIRKVGRPRNEWAVMLQRECSRMNPDFRRMIDDELEWKRAVHTYCSSSGVVA